jgi:CheY-like chemotaxis protein
MDNIAEPKNKTILVADDEQFIILAYKKGLELAGYNVIVARDGQETLDKVKELNPDLVLLDLIMPKLSGFEVMQALKKDPKLTKIPVFVLTNLSQDNDETEVKNLGAVNFFIKANVALNDVVLAIDNYFS